VASWLGYTIDMPALNIVLPVGISFYTFHTITYIVDCCRGVITPTGTWPSSRRTSRSSRSS